jgi:hypothetical protein
MVNKNRKFSLLAILFSDYSILFALLIPFVLGFSHLLALFGYIPDGSGFGFTVPDESDIASSQTSTIFFSIVAITYFVIRIRFFYILYKRGVEVSSTILEYSCHTRGARIQYEYIYDNKKYCKGNSLSYAFKKNDFHEGQEVMLLVDPKKPTRAIIKNIYF